MYDRIVLLWSSIHSTHRQRARILEDGSIVYTYKDSEWGTVVVVMDADGTQHIHTYHATNGHTTNE